MSPAQIIIVCFFGTPLVLIAFAAVMAVCTNNGERRTTALKVLRVLLAFLQAVLIAVVARRR